MKKSFTLAPMGDNDDAAWEVTDGGLPENERVTLKPTTTAEGTSWRIVRNGETSTLSYNSRDAALDALRQDLASTSPIILPSR